MRKIDIVYQVIYTGFVLTSMPMTELLPFNVLNHFKTYTLQLWLEWKDFLILQCQNWHHIVKQCLVLLTSDYLVVLGMVCFMFILLWYILPEEFRSVWLLAQNSCCLNSTVINDKTTCAWIVSSYDEVRMGKNMRRVDYMNAQFSFGEK